MRYIPGLIPERSKVLPEYFKGERHADAHQSANSNAGLTIIALLLFFAAFAFASHGWVLLLLAAAGMSILPYSTPFIERTLRFSYTSRIRAATCCVLLLCSVPMVMHGRQKTGKGP